MEVSEHLQFSQTFTAAKCYVILEIMPQMSQIGDSKETSTTTEMDFSDLLSTIQKGQEKLRIQIWPVFLSLPEIPRVFPGTFQLRVNEILTSVSLAPYSARICSLSIIYSSMHWTRWSVVRGGNGVIDRVISYSLEIVLPKKNKQQNNFVQASIRYLDKRMHSFRLFLCKWKACIFTTGYIVIFS